MSRSGPLLFFALTLAGPACSAPAPRIVRLPSAQLRGSMSVANPEPRRHHVPGHAKRSAAGFVEDALHARGIRFGTDGSLGALYAFVQGDFERIPAERAQPGDVVFFDTGGGCGSHVGLVEGVEASGRIAFREWRNGGAMHSFATPRLPVVRRNEEGAVLNTFLRIKRMEDPVDTRYFAGDMLCAAFRIVSR